MICPVAVERNREDLLMHLALTGVPSGAAVSLFFCSTQPPIRRGQHGRDGGQCLLWEDLRQAQGWRRQRPRSNGYRVCVAPSSIEGTWLSGEGWVSSTIQQSLLMYLDDK